MAIPHFLVISEHDCFFFLCRSEPFDIFVLMIVLQMIELERFEILVTLGTDFSVTIFIVLTVFNACR